MNAVAVYKDMLQEMHNGWLQGTVADVTPEMASWQPPGHTVSIAALYSHVIVAEDALLLGGVGGAPLLAGPYAGRTGFSAMPPVGHWESWARGGDFDIDQLRAYGAAVFAASEEAVGRLNDADLERVVDLSFAGLGQMSIANLLRTLVIHGAAHTGEVSAVKGLQSQRGYPF